MKDYSELIVSLKKHFLLMNENKGLIIVEDEAAREHIVDAFAENISKRNFQVIKLNIEKAKEIYAKKEEYQKMPGFIFVVLEDCYEIDSLVVQDVLRMFEKKSRVKKYDLKVLLCSTVPCEKGSEMTDLIYDYAAENLLYKEDTKNDSMKIIEERLGRVIKGSETRTDKRRAGFYLILDEEACEYRFDIYEDQVKGMLALRKDKEALTGAHALSAAEIIDKFFSYGCVKPELKDMEIFLNAYRTMEMPPRMMLG